MAEGNLLSEFGYLQYLPPFGAITWEEKWDAHRKFVKDFILQRGVIKEAYKRKLIAKVHLRIHPDDYEALRWEVFEEWDRRVDAGRHYAPVTLSYLCRKHIATRWALLIDYSPFHVENLLWQCKSIKMLRKCILELVCAQVEWVDKRFKEYKDWDYETNGKRTVEICFYTTREFAKKFSLICRKLRIPKGILFSFLLRYAVNIKAVENVLQHLGVDVPSGEPYIDLQALKIELGEPPRIVWKNYRSLASSRIPPSPDVVGWEHVRQVAIDLAAQRYKEREKYTRCTQYPNIYVAVPKGIGELYYFTVEEARRFVEKRRKELENGTVMFSDGEVWQALVIEYSKLKVTAMMGTVSPFDECPPWEKAGWDVCVFCGHKLEGHPKWEKKPPVAVCPNCAVAFIIWEQKDELPPYAAKEVIEYWKEGDATWYW